MTIPNWAVEALMRGVGSVVDKVPPEKLDHLKQRAGQWLDEIPQAAARGVDTMFRGARLGKEKLDRWARRHVALVTPVINATGCLMEPRVQGVPIAEGIIDISVEGLACPSLRTALAEEKLTRRLNHCAGKSDWAILVPTSVDSACLAVGLTWRDRPIFFHRCQSHRLSSGVPIPDAFFPRGPSSIGQDQIREVGSVDGFSSDDCNGLPEDAILVAVADGSPNPIWYQSLCREDGRHPSSRIHILLMPVCGGIRNAGQASEASVFAAVEPPLLMADDFLTGGHTSGPVDLVITPGDGVLGGPACGLMIGNKTLIDTITDCRAWPSLSAKTLTKAMLTQTLETLGGRDAESLPVIAMFTTCEENLRGRAERMATRLTADEVIAASRITDEPARITPKGPWKIPSRQLRVRHQHLPASCWADQLISDFPALLTRVEDEEVVIDLRWV